MSCNFGFHGYLVGFVGRVQPSQRSLVSLTDLAELLHMLTSRIQVNLRDLEH